MSKKDKRPSFSFFSEKFMLQCLKDKYFFINFSVSSRKKNDKNVIDIPEIEDMLHTMRKIFESIIFKTANKNFNKSRTL